MFSRLILLVVGVVLITTKIVVSKINSCYKHQTYRQTYTYQKAKMSNRIVSFLARTSLMSTQSSWGGIWTAAHTVRLQLSNRTTLVYPTNSVSIWSPEDRTKVNYIHGQQCIGGAYICKYLALLHQTDAVSGNSLRIL